MPSFETNSPLRYPGGKAILTDFLAATIAANKIEDCTYVEPYAGGAGAAVNLLLAGKVANIALNDADRTVWSFWQSVLDHTDSLVGMIANTPVSVEEWQKQRAIYRARSSGTVELGFAAFYLNRCNRSGIMPTGGVIGGQGQNGRWKINARYNPPDLIRRIERLAALRDRIRLSCLDAIEFLRAELPAKEDRSRYFVYLDPPYFVKGSRLYLNFYAPEDHAALATFLRGIGDVRWLVTYDDAPEIRKLYSWRRILEFRLQYSAASAKQGCEIMIPSRGLRIPMAELRNSA